MSFVSAVDIAIIGGGMVGTALACALRMTPFRIALIDTELPTIREDARFIALTETNVRFLKSLHVWDSIASQASPIRAVHVSQQGHFGATRLTTEGLACDVLGYVIPAHFIQRALDQKIAECSTIHCLRPATLAACEEKQDHVALTLETPSGTAICQAKVVVGADGSDSKVRELFKIPVDIVDYQQSAIVTLTTLKHDHQGIAYERFQPQGAIAFLPLPNACVGTVWSGATSRMLELMEKSESEFRMALQNDFGHRLGYFQKTGKRVMFPLKKITAQSQKKGRAVLIGNAAHTLHPVAAQGLNIALHEVAILQQHFSNPRFLLDEFQTMSMFTEVSRFRQSLSHRLAEDLTHDFAWKRMVRAWGLTALDLSFSLKKQFIQHAMGYLVEPFLT